MPKNNHRRKLRLTNGCLFCFCDDKDEIHLGKFYQLGEIKAHYYCLLFSSGLMQKGATDDKGILGFMPKDIYSELRRGKRLKCCYCKLAGATIGCINTKCRRAYHLPCGIRNESMLQFFDAFPSYCSIHRICQPPLKEKKDKTCSICMESVQTDVTAHTLYPPCCCNGWFHRDCLQMLALNTGYFFKCPLCNNKDKFQSDMQKFGIYVPEQDAAWEREQGAFSELYVRYNNCDATVCLCPDGRNRDDDGKTIASRWELVLCQTCGSQGMHIACGDLSYDDPVWECPDCQNVAKKTSVTKTRAPNIRSPRRQPRLRQTSLNTPRRIELELSEETTPATPTRASQRESSQAGPHTPRRNEPRLCQETARTEVTTTSESRQYKMRRKKLVLPLPVSSASSRSSSPICFSPIETMVKGSPSSIHNLDFRMRKVSDSDSDSSDKERALNIKNKILLHNESDSSDSTPTKPLTSPNLKPNLSFSLKGPSTFNSNTGSSIIFGGAPAETKYNPSIPLTNPFFKVTNPSLVSSQSKITLQDLNSGRSFSGTVILVDSTDEDDDVVPMPVIEPIVDKPKPTYLVDVVDLSSDSDSSKNEIVSTSKSIDHEIKPTLPKAAQCNVDTKKSWSQKRASRSSSSSSEEGELIVPHPVKKARILTNKKRSQYEIKESIHTGQLSIMKYMSNNKMAGKDVFVPEQKVQRKRDSQKTPSPTECPLKITSFFHSQTKMYVIKYPDDEDEENSEPQSTVTT